MAENEYHTDEAEKSPPSNLIPSEFTTMGKKVSCMEMAAEDTKRLVADNQKFMESRTRLLSKRWLSSGSAGSTRALHCWSFDAARWR